MMHSIRTKKPITRIYTNIYFWGMLGKLMTVIWDRESVADNEIEFH